VAVQALSFVRGDPERLGLFLAESGSPGDRSLGRPADPHFLASVLDFILRDDATVTAFAAASELDPTTIAAARESADEDPSRARRAVNTTAPESTGRPALPGLPW